MKCGLRRRLPSTIVVPSGSLTGKSSTPKPFFRSNFDGFDNQLQCMIHAQARGVARDSVLHTIAQATSSVRSDLLHASDIDRDRAVESRAKIDRGMDDMRRPKHFSRGARTSIFSTSRAAAQLVQLDVEMLDLMRHH